MEKIRVAPIQIDIPLLDCVKGAKYAVTPWSEHLRIYSRYDCSQTAERIAERGGFGIREAHDYYGWETPIVWFRLDNGYAKYKLIWNEEKIHWIKQSTENGWVEGSNIVLPIEALQRLRIIFENNEDNISLCCVKSKIEFVDIMINSIIKANK